jgi:hypothetical protein
MDVDIRHQLKPGARVRVTQQIAARNHTWTSEIRGTVMEYEQKQTGSWFAHSKADRLWLDRLLIRKDDGELTTLNLDDYSHIELEPTAPAAAADAGAKKNESDLPV